MSPHHGPRARQVRLSPPVRRELKVLWASGKAPHQSVLRSRIILLASRGLTNVEIAQKVGCTDRTVRKWRKRFAERPIVKSLADLRRSGRPPQITAESRCHLIQIACSRPDPERTAFRQAWTYQALRQALCQQTGTVLSLSEIGRILRDREIRPHRNQYWLHSPDPDFKDKVHLICNLYRNPPPGSSVLCIDEKTSMQALERKHPFQPARPGKPGREEFEYIRHGIQTLIAAFNTRTGKVFSHCGATRTADDLMSFMEAIAAHHKHQVNVIWDNLNTHKGIRWDEFNERHGGRFRFFYTPLHASWINQIEVWFSILSRRVLRLNSFVSKEDLKCQVEGFIRHWNEHEAHPFNWTFRGRFLRHQSAA